jgi:ribosomal protein S18 acetylase RimI-like enzyme
VVTKPKIQILDAAAVPAEALALFFREVWDRDATAELVTTSRRQAAVANLAEPGVEVPTTVVVADDRVVGYCSSLPIQLWDGHASHPGYWAKGLMVLPEYRNGPIGYLVLKELVGRLRRSIVLTVAPASVRLFEALGYANLGMVANYVSILRPGRLASKVPIAALGGRLPGLAVGAVRFAQQSGVLRLAGAVTGLGVRAATGVFALSRIGLTVDHADRLPPSEDLDSLWLAARRSGLSGVVRDARYLGQRYGGVRYHFVTVRERGTLRALAIMQAPREQSDERVRGLSIGTLSDLVVGPDDSRAAIAATRGAAALARALGGDALLASTPSRWLGRLLVSQAWLAVSRNLRFLVRETDPARAWPSSLESWWLMRGDGESDGAL